MVVYILKISSSRSLLLKIAKYTLYIDTDLITLIFEPTVPLLQFEYLHKGAILEAKILGIFIYHLGLNTGKISLKSVRLIEDVFCCLSRLAHMCIKGRKGKEKKHMRMNGGKRRSS